MALKKYNSLIFMHYISFFFLYIGLALTSCQNSSQKAASSPVQLAKAISQPIKATESPKTIPEGLQRLLKAYPNQFKSASENELVWQDGSTMVFDDGKKNKTHQELLDSPDLEDQLSQVYPKGSKYDKPAKNHDPGRIRYEAFLKKMYGQSAVEVQKNLTTVIWLPKTLKVRLSVTKINDVHLKLKAVSEELDALPHLHKYLKAPGGTFNWRNIAGTKRLSAHSFGMTIDINVAHSHYWQNEAGSANENFNLSYKNSIPLEIVEIFEKHGFIWGGKWYHYDTMHFEYRPELLVDL